MRIILLGAAGFIGTNLVFELAKNRDDNIVVIDRDARYFHNFEEKKFPNVELVESNLEENTDYDQLTKDCDIVYHLVSTTVPTTSNRRISQELSANVIVSTNLFEACARNHVKKIVFISSGGTVYGKEVNCPLDEDTPTNPITSYGVQKIAIEKLLSLYSYMYGFDYRIIRLANPYGPYQRPNGVLGAVTTFTYKALKHEKIQVYGDGSVVRDYIYIDDAVRGILTIVNGEDHHHIFNLGCGYGTSIKKVLKTIEDTLGTELDIEYTEARKVDVPINYLDISRYEKAYGRLNPIELYDGIKRTADFMRQYYKID